MSYLFKAVYRDQENIKGFLSKYGIGEGNTMFLTFTTKNIISDKKLVSKHFNTFLTFLRSPRYREKFQHVEYDKYLKETKAKTPRNFELNMNMVHSPLRYFCCWELQKRGSWHCHMIIHLPFWSTTQFNKFLRFCRNTISGSVWGFLEAKWTYGNMQGVKCYLSKYATKELRQHNKGTRLVSYSRNFPRIVRLPFMWVDGKASDWREMWRCIAGMLPESVNTLYEDMSYMIKADLFNYYLESNFKLMLRELLTFIKDHYPEWRYRFAFNQLESYRARMSSTQQMQLVGQGV